MIILFYLVIIPLPFRKVHFFQYLYPTPADNIFLRSNFIKCPLACEASLSVPLFSITCIDITVTEDFTVILVIYSYQLCRYSQIPLTLHKNSISTILYSNRIHRVCNITFYMWVSIALLYDENQKIRVAFNLSKIHRDVGNILSTFTPRIDNDCNFHQKTTDFSIQSLVSSSFAATIQPVPQPRPKYFRRDILLLTDSEERYKVVTSKTRTLFRVLCFRRREVSIDY